MTTSTDKKENSQKEILEVLDQIGQNQAQKNSLVYNEKTGEFETISADQALQDDPDRIVINEIGEKGWATYQHL